MSDKNELDVALERLHAAEKDGAAEHVLAELRNQVRNAANREAHARQTAREALEKAQQLAERGPGFLTGDGQPEPCVMLVPRESEGQTLATLPLGASRFGGVPDLPADVAWPIHNGRKLPFLAQIDLAELPVRSSLLPSKGWLLAFGLFDDDFPLHVIHCAGERAALRRASVPEASDIWRAGRELLYDLVPLICKDPKGVMPVADYGKKNCCGWLFGGVDDFWGTAGELAFDTWRSGDDWINLLMIDSVGSMQWCDCGHLYLLARRSDLAAGNLSNVFACVCST